MAAGDVQRHQMKTQKAPATGTSHKTRIAQCGVHSAPFGGWVAHMHHAYKTAEALRSAQVPSISVGLMEELPLRTKNLSELLAPALLGQIMSHDLVLFF